MIRIELEPLEQKDLLEMLDYASEMKEKNRPVRKTGRSAVWDDTDYWINRIEILKRILQGKTVRDSVYRSSLGTLDTGKNEEKDYVRRSKELLNLEEVDE